jgi:hypothetical protein
MNHSNDPDMAWLAENFKSEAEKILVDKGRDRLRTLGTSRADFQATWLELDNLRRGRDFSYDTPECGVVYSWVYHQKRLQQALRVLHTPLRAALQDDQPVDIVDLGSGTGAVLWAVAALLLAFDKRGLRPAQPVRILECDSSPFMLGTSKSLWDALNNLFPRLRALLERLPSKPASWDRISLESPRSPWITASYLLHASETTSLESDMELVESLGRIADRVAASRLITWHSAEKTPTMRDALEILVSRGWKRDDLEPANLRFTGEDERSSKIRLAVEAHTQDLSSALSQDAPHPAYWYSKLDDKRPLRCEAVIRPARVGESLFSAPTGTGWRFDAEQQQIVDDKRKHAVVRGAAGSGKTVVLAERVRQAVIAATPSQPRHMLVTCFNTKVIDHIYDLLKDQLSARSTGRLMKVAKSGKWTFTDSNAKVTALNFDKLPLEFLEVKQHIGTIVKGQERLLLSQVSDLLELRTGKRLDHDWLLDELRLIIYGRCQGSLDAYLRPRQRRGRPDISIDLDIIFRAIEQVLGSLENPTPPKTWSQRRAKLLYYLLHRDDQTPTIRPPYTDMFVDEGQDLTRSDWKILQLLAGPETAWTICFDRTQAIHTGKTFDSPSGVVEKLSGWGVALPGAYRVPRPVVRFANKLVDLGYIKAGDGLIKSIHQDDRPIPVEPKMHAMPGPRPIIVFGDSDPSLFQNIVDVLEAHAQARRSCQQRSDNDHNGNVLIGDFMGSPLQIKSQERTLEDILVKRKRWCEVLVGSVLGVKGVEYDTVIWLADAALQDTERWGEHLFVLFTRTRGLLLIAYTKRIDDRARKFLSQISANYTDLARWLPGARNALHRTNQTSSAP